MSLDQERERSRELYTATRARTEALASRLSAEDQQIQSMPDASPAKWHRAHTTWFFETFVLAPAGVAPVDPRYGFLFNSYYDGVGPRHARPKRGLLSRPTAAEVGDYRRIVDDRVAKLLTGADAETLARALPVVELGVNHEEQHQELLLTDILHAFSESPLRPAYLAEPPVDSGARRAVAGRVPDPLRFVPFDGGLAEIGAGADGFAFDNERPRHKEWVEPFAIADRLVTVHELGSFVRAAGYHTPSLWLAEGYDFVRAHDLGAPMHAALEEGAFHLFTLGGWRIAGADDPVVHVSYYEADAIARFLGGRLPTEAEWEVASARASTDTNFMDDGRLSARPATRPARDVHPLRQMFGDAWEWTRSSYEAYPGFEPPRGAIGEYNGKFMVNQRVLRGGSCLTPRRHIRPTYRNFWPATTRFQMTGIRIVRGVGA
jgi:ergothioneine biosynthesis protein EgtB